MTFDLNWVNRPPEKVAEVKALWEEMAATVEPKDRLGVLERIHAAQVYHFGCNNGFMGRIVFALRTLNMLDMEFKHSPWTNNEEQDEMVVKEYDKVLGLPPYYKFNSNDGWVVSPAEITRALAVNDKFPKSVRQLMLDVAFEEDADCIRRFEELLEFWREAAKHGGFEVH